MALVELDDMIIMRENTGMISLKETGVYLIVNLLNGKVYVGSTSKSFAKRFRNHRHDLEKGIHHSHPLQRSWKKYGEDAFLFMPLESALPDRAVAREQIYIDGWKPEYNLSPIAGSARGVKHTEIAKQNMRIGFKKSNARPEVRINRSLSQLAVWSQPEAKARKTAGQNRPDVKRRKRESVLLTWKDPEISERRIAGMLKAHATPEAKARKSEVMKKRWQDPEYREYMIGVRHRNAG